MVDFLLPADVTSIYHDGNVPSVSLRDSFNMSSRLAHEAASSAYHISPIDFWKDLLALMGFLSVVFLAGKLVQLLGGPSLIGEMIAGIVLGPNVLNLAPEPRSLILLGDFGLCLLMVEAGLEIDVSLLKQVGIRGMIIALTGTILPFSLGIGLAMGAFGFTFKGAFSAGAALQPTSLAIVLGVLKKGGTLNTPTGQLIVAAAAIDDVIAVILLSEVEALASPSVKNFLIPVVAALAFLVVVGALAILVIPKVLSDYVLPKVSPKHREYLVLGCILTTAIALQAAAAGARSSYLLGALLAGLSFSTIRSAEHVWELQVKRALHWCIKIFFSATIGFEVPIRSFWTGKVLYQSAAFFVPVLLKMLVGLYAVPRSKANILTVGIAMCARGEFGFIIALRGRTLEFLTQEQYASLMLPLLLAAIIVPFALKATITLADKKGRAKFDEAEFDTGVDAVLHFKPVYYQMRLKCFNSFGLMNEILETAGKENLQVMDARIHSVGNYADDVFYFKDLQLKAPVKVTNGDEASKKALKEVQDRLDDLYETFLQRALAVAKSAQSKQSTRTNPAAPHAANGGIAGIASRRLSLDLILPRTRSSTKDDNANGEGDEGTEEFGEVDLVFVRWLPGMVDQVDASFDSTDGEVRDGTDSVMFQQIAKQLELEDMKLDALTKAFSVGSMSKYEGHGESSRRDGQSTAPKMVVAGGGRRASIEMLVAAEVMAGMEGGPGDGGFSSRKSRVTADKQLREGLLINAARDLDKYAAKQNKHAGFSRFEPQQYEKAADTAYDGSGAGNSGGYSRRSIDFGPRPAGV